MKTWFTIQAAANGEKKSEISIFDEIGLWGVTAKDFATQLKAIPEDHSITVAINSPGGSVFDGYAIFNALRARAANVTTRIEGLAASMASVIALAGSKVTAATNSVLMIHNPWSGVAGDSDEMRKMADLLDKLTGQLVNIYAQKTGLPEADVRAAMDAETWFTAAEAMEWGLVDELTDEIPVAASFNLSRFRNFKASAHKPAQPKTTTTMTKSVVALGLSEDATDEQALAKIEELKTETEAAKASLATAAAEAATLKAAHNATAAELATLKAEKAKRDARDCITSAIAAGRITEASREKFEAMHVEDAAKCAELLASMPPRRGEAPVQAEKETETNSDSRIFAEYSAITDSAARRKFLASNRDAIWRHRSTT